MRMRKLLKGVPKKGQVYHMEDTMTIFSNTYGSKSRS